MPGVSHVQQEAHVAANRALRKKGLRTDSNAKARMESTSPELTPGITHVQQEVHTATAQTLRKKGLRNKNAAERDEAKSTGDSFPPGSMPEVSRVHQEDNMAASQASRKKGLGQQNNKVRAESRASAASSAARSVSVSATVPLDAPSEVARPKNPPSTVEVSHSEAQQEEQQRERRSSIQGFPVVATLVEDDGFVTNEDRQRMKEELRNEIFHEAVIGETIGFVDEQDSLPPRNKRRKFILCGMLVFAVILLIAIVLGFVLGTKRSTSSSAQATLSKATFSPTLLSRPSSSPTTLSPTVSSHPSTSPTTTSPTVSSRPSASPTASSPPSLSPTISSSPTISNANRNNTNRSEAQFLELNAPPLEAAVSSFAYQLVGGACRRLDNKLRSLATYQGYFWALWYTYTPKRSGPVSAISCGPVSFYAYQSSYECFSDGVYKGVYGTNGDMGHCGGTSFSWEAKEGVTYTLLVYLTNGTAADKQDDDDVATIQIVDNDHCGHAFGPAIATGVGTTLSYTTLGAQVDEGEVQASCGGSSAATAPGVWFTVKGAGQPITASTCGPETTFDTQITVFRGDCDSLVCVNGNDNLCGQQSSVDWPSQADEIYYILVHGGSSNSAGEFQLTISTDFVRLENDFCVSAMEVSLENATASQTIPFSLAGSTADPDVPLCSNQFFSNSANEEIPYGIWYVVQGSGSPVHVSYYVAADQEFVVNVYSGSCGGLACLEETNAQSGGTTYGFSTQLCFDANPEETYYIYLSTTLLSSIDEQNGDIGFGTCFLESVEPDTMCREIPDCGTCMSTEVPNSVVGGSTCSWFGDQDGYCGYLVFDADADNIRRYCPDTPDGLCEQGTDCNSCLQLQLDENTNCTWVGICSTSCWYSQTEFCYSAELLPGLSTEEICEKSDEFEVDLALCEVASETCENCTSRLKSNGKPCEWWADLELCQYGYEDSEESKDTCDEL